MSDPRQAIAEALSAQAVTQPPNPYQVNQVMEQQAAQNSPPLHPVIAALMNKMGLLAAFRNRRNQPLMDPEAIPPVLPQ